MKLIWNELRIGNLINAYSLNDKRKEDLRVAKVTLVSDWVLDYDYDGNFNHCTCEPIPLTEDWLVRFGFEKHGTNPFWFMKGILCVSIIGKIELLSWDLQAFRDLNIEIKSIHQLQNLYFALTGTELTINQ